MTTGIQPSCTPMGERRSAAPTRPDRFWLWLAFTIAAWVLAGFWFSYFARIALPGPSGIRPLVHVHGWSFFLWYLLLAVQATLARTGGMALHRTLGACSMALASIMVASGTIVIGVRMEQARLAAEPSFWSVYGPTVFAMLALFTGFYVAALRLRRSGDWHKRFMVVASVAALGAALFRVALLAGLGGMSAALPVGMLSSYLVIVAGIVRDRLRERRVHPAWWIGLATCASVETMVELTTPTVLGQPLNLALAWIGREFGGLY